MKRTAAVSLCLFFAGVIFLMQCSKYSTKSFIAAEDIELVYIQSGDYMMVAFHMIHQHYRMKNLSTKCISPTFISVNMKLRKNNMKQ